MSGHAGFIGMVCFWDEGWLLFGLFLKLQKGPVDLQTSRSVWWASYASIKAGVNESSQGISRRITLFSPKKIKPREVTAAVAPMSSLVHHLGFFWNVSSCVFSKVPQPASSSGRPETRDSSERGESLGKEIEQALEDTVRRHLSVHDQAGL